MSKTPFEFDLRVSADKAKRKTGRRGGMSGAFDSSTRPCDFPGCKEKGAIVRRNRPIFWTSISGSAGKRYCE